VALRRRPIITLWISLSKLRPFNKNLKENFLNGS